MLNASFGNAVELILSIIALKEGKIDVVQASLLGSVLSNLLLVSFFFASIFPNFIKCSYILLSQLSFFLGGLMLSPDNKVK